MSTTEGVSTELAQQRGSGERMVRANGVDLCVETFGNPADPAIVLIGGAASSMDWWQTDFCTRLAAGPRYVIRYDLRDTGRSVSYPAGKPGYTGPDLVEDLVGLLDALGVAQAHLVGISMGAGIALVTALDHPERVRSLGLLSFSPAGPGGPDNGLPPVSERFGRSFAELPPTPDWSDRDAVVEYVIAGLRPFAGSRTEAEAVVRDIVARIVDRTRDMAATMTNHGVLDGGDPIRHRLGEIAVPTLVWHGTEDPLFPLPHGEALAREIPGARLLPLHGVGHEVPPRSTWDEVVPALLAHTAR